MSETTTSTAASGVTRAPGAPIWADMATPDVDAALKFYNALFGWEGKPEENPDAGGYALARLDGKDVAGIGPLQEGQFPAWSVYFHTTDAAATSEKVEAAGGKVIMPAFEVLDSGRMAVYQDPTGAFFSVWEPNTMPGFGRSHVPNTFGWPELNAPGIDKAEAFYTQVFGWGVKKSDGPPPYTEWQLDGQSIGGAIDTAAVPGMDQVPPNWIVYFTVSDVDATAAKVTELGGKVQMGPSDYPGGRFAIVSDPTGPVFGLMTEPGE